MILRADNLRVQFRPDQPVLDDVSAAFLPGELAAILGPNGAGKSTLIRALAGIDPVAGAGRSGGVALDGIPIAAWSADARAARLACLPQREEVPTGFSVREVVRFGALASGARDRTPDQEQAPLRRLGLLPLADRPVQTLSEGQRQRVALARAFAQTRGWAPGPGVLIADEPAAALDPALAMDAMTLFRELAQLGRTVIVVLHDMNLALRFAHRALLLSRAGRVAADGPAPRALAPDILEQVFGLPWSACTLPGGGAAVIPAFHNPTISPP